LLIVPCLQAAHDGWSSFTSISIGDMARRAPAPVFLLARLRNGGVAGEDRHQ
jgi:hypothetical protein